MSLKTGARLVRLQPQVQIFGHRSSCASGIGLRVLDSRHFHSNAPRTISPRCIYALNLDAKTATTLRRQFHRQFTSTTHKRDDDSSKNNLAPNPDPLSDPLNPPASTRPPPLDLPTRAEGQSLPSYLFAVGKKYLSFYWAGIKAIFANRKLLLSLPDIPRPNLPQSPSSFSPPPLSTTTTTKSPSSSPLDKSANPSRAVLLLRARVRHDLSRLPFFGIVVIVCGELTPLLVLLFPRLTPYTCRIPAQTAVIRRSVEARRAASFRNLAHVVSSSSTATADTTTSTSSSSIPPALEKLADGHICRSLDRGSILWDKVGLDPPFASAKAREAVSRIVGDDALLREVEVGNDTGVNRLVDDEVVLACEARGIDTLARIKENDIASLRRDLETWVSLTAPSQITTAGEDPDAAVRESTLKVRRLLLGLGRL
ncbi:hypothetical protein F5Y17DRAFT_156381 [Xylariaceae sp. FL0594]|nr:hypothetical protein F5Y17DRAFT_156381 [Xylariaceae sp. FL0594]